MVTSSEAPLLSELETQASALLRAVERSFLAAQLASGKRDPNRLADSVFHLRHPELRGRRIGTSEPLLAGEWRSIRRDLVEPLLASGGGAAKPAAPDARAPGPAGVPGTADPDVAAALRIARAPVPGMPGKTIQALVEPWRAAISPEIPMAVLLAFMRYESGGNFADATHGSPRNDPPYTQPAFYELGLFQTPAGLHGACTTGDPRSCQHAPPGREAPGDPSTWARLCKRLGADPADWRNPTTQVRVGLTDLAGSGRAVRMEFARLFPSPGSDWDLRMAVLLPFARGRGFARAFLHAFRAELEGLPEGERWGFLRGKRARAARGGTWAFDASNVDKKMALAAKLGYAPPGG